MNCDFVCRGRPFGGCSILYRRCLSSCISPLHSCSDRFCGVKLSDKNGLTYLLVSVYMPTFYDPSSCDNYLNVLGELEAFIGSNHCDIVIVGDFNVDFDRGGLFAKLLKDFMIELDLCVCDLGFSSSVKYTYERDDSLSRSWLDHVLCSKRFSNLFSDFHAIHSPSIHSDHFPLFFNIDITCTIIPLNNVFPGPKLPLLILIDTAIWFLPPFLNYHLKFSPVLFPISLSILIPLAHMLRNLFLPYLTVLANVFHIPKHLLVHSLVGMILPVTGSNKQPIFGTKSGKMQDTLLLEFCSR